MLQLLLAQPLEDYDLSELRYVVSGGAPLPPEVAQDVVRRLPQVEIREGYGLTESAALATSTPPGGSRLGSVGQAAPGYEIRIEGDDEIGEICVRSPSVMLGYWQQPEATAETVVDGWLHTGDLGRIDADGFLFITDRKKDLLITSGGKNVAPQPIEQLLTAQPAIAQAVVVGDNYPYLTALIAPSFEDLPPELAGRSQEALLADPAFERRVDAAIDAVNAELSEHERIRNWQFLPRELSQAEGEVTPTLKVRRRIVLERYRDLVASMYLKTQKVPYA
jgi:long-chain acyl-CoA synthetase